MDHNSIYGVGEAGEWKQDVAWGQLSGLALEGPSLREVQQQVSQQFPNSSYTPLIL
ncbi:hypothetical protein BS47DRAFT_1355485 [Hydnum rufescens UP504]|uniref:Uncharacterized protein n=1 Tax=Hydnum rufescens UP504 TaxID=1448309 RepID=A0A9P6AFD0_9AGAM|nr:hypothetical protein BS47DRAFT_1355485 [Hydnum rufescens UP504]